MRSIALTLAAGTLALGCAPLGGAGTRGTWTPVTGSGLSNSTEIGLARTANGLHVVWPAGMDLLQRTISSGGAAGATTTVVRGWSSLTGASLVKTSSGLQAFWAGLRSTSTTDPYSSGTVFTATSGNGASWALATGPAAAASNAYATDIVGATMGKGGVPVTSWTGTSGFYVHRGVDPATPNVKVQSACCAYEASLAADSKSGDVYAAWYSNAHGGSGIHVRQVVPSLGSDHVLPGSGSGNNAVSPIGAVGITGRDGAAGVCAAYGAGYPAWKAVNLWCSGHVLRVWSGPVTLFSVAPALDGRVWVIWSTSSAIYAARTNKTATVIGAPVAVGAPHGTSDIWKLAGDATAAPNAPLDLLASVTTHGIAFWHTQVRPGLTLDVKPHQSGASFAVLDAGDHVSGAVVKVTGTHDATVGAGASLPAGHYTATASAAGYTSATATFTVSG
jgi:hypothetical protein